MTSKPFILVGVVMLATPAAVARDKTDVIILANGDRLTGEIKKLERGKLSVSTTYMSTIEIEWRGVVGIESNYGFQVETQSGTMYFGSIGPSEEGHLEIRAGNPGATFPVSSVVRMKPIDDRFWDRIVLSMNLGYNFTSSNTVTQWSFGTSALYRKEKYEGSLDLSSFLNAQGEVDTTTRNTLGLRVNRALDNRWLVSWLGQFQQDSELSLDLRTLFGAGIGRYLLQTTRVELSALGGGAYSREWFEGEDPANNAEAFGGVDVDVFIFGGRKTDVSTFLLVLPNISQRGRVRMEFQSKLRVELFKDLFWSIEVFDSLDSDPPRQDIQKNSFGVGTSLGWKF